MLQPHSLLWHYLWLGPHVLQAALAVLLWRRGLHKQFPLFFAYLVYEASEEFTLWTLDVLPSLSAVTYWRTCYTGVVIEGLLTFAIIWELLANLVHPRPAEAKLGKRLIIFTGGALVLLAVLGAAHMPIAHWQIVWVGRTHALLLALYIVLSGLTLFLFLFAAYHELTWDRRALGIALGFGIDWCQHLAIWALITSGTLIDGRLEFLNMATYHVCVLIWLYYLLSPSWTSAAAAKAPAISEAKPDAQDGPTVRRLRPAWLLSKS